MPQPASGATVRWTIADRRSQRGSLLMGPMVTSRGALQASVVAAAASGMVGGPAPLTSRVSRERDPRHLKLAAHAERDEALCLGYCGCEPTRMSVASALPVRAAASGCLLEVDPAMERYPKFVKRFLGVLVLAPRPCRRIGQGVNKGLA
ncbi:hypothetical protein Vretifemale_5371 [Volvox reticuliferus]|uniref:Uncharacterized protein n=1 Tax=Volvox reticuliferus TaxID=1737510 RepID=A0A8J4FID1_9CHLO|nr:hypothetical protein Vretifemale_5371 [Volvox reticuliferus]